MALWQFTLNPIPALNARVHGIEAIRLSSEQLEGIDICVAVHDIEPLFSRLDGLLPEKKSWDKNLRIWGDEKSDDIQVWFDQDIIAAIQFRLDVSNLSPRLINGLCILARGFGWLLVTEDGAIIQPTKKAIIRAAMQSATGRYVQYPQEFLEEAARREIETD